MMNNYITLKILGQNRNSGRITYLVQNEHDRYVLKKFQFAKGADWQGFKELDREISILKSLDHPNIPKYVESFETDDGFCLVQEYIAAPSLGEIRSRSLDEIKAITTQTLEILVYLQSLHPPVLHRDIKPDNLLWDGETAYLVDFGLSRLGGQNVAYSSIVVGTTGFMPPELTIGRDPTKASDLYSLGATILSLCTGTPSHKMADLMGEDFSFDGRHFQEIGDGTFSAWLKKMCAVRVGDRFADAVGALDGLKPSDQGKISLSEKWAAIEDLVLQTNQDLANLRAKRAERAKSNLIKITPPSLLRTIPSTSKKGSDTEIYYSDTKDLQVYNPDFGWKHGYFTRIRGFEDIPDLHGFLYDDEFYYSVKGGVFKKKQALAFATADYLFDISEVSPAIQQAAETLLVHELTKGWLKPWMLNIGSIGALCSVVLILILQGVQFVQQPPAKIISADVPTNINNYPDPESFLIMTIGSLLYTKGLPIALVVATFSVIITIFRRVMEDVR